MDDNMFASCIKEDSDHMKQERIRFGDVEFTKRTDGKPVAIIQIDTDTKTGKREMVMNEILSKILSIT